MSTCIPIFWLKSLLLTIKWLAHQRTGVSKAAAAQMKSWLQPSPGEFFGSENGITIRYFSLGYHHVSPWIAIFWVYHGTEKKHISRLIVHHCLLEEWTIVLRPWSFARNIHDFNGKITMVVHVPKSENVTTSGAPLSDSSRSVGAFITPISLCFMLDISILTRSYKPTFT